MLTRSMSACRVGGSTADLRSRRSWNRAQGGLGFFNTVLVLEPGNVDLILFDLAVDRLAVDSHHPRDLVEVPFALPENPHQIFLLGVARSEEHTSELQSLAYLVCRLLLEKK